MEGRPIPPEVLDRAPETEEERSIILNVLADQLRQLRDAGEARVTCPCGRDTCVALASRCHWCGLWFCRKCADRHFGPAPVPVVPRYSPALEADLAAEAQYGGTLGEGIELELRKIKEDEDRGPESGVRREDRGTQGPDPGPVHPRILPSEMEGAVADRLRRLRAKGQAEKIGDGWKRSGAPGSART